MTLEADINCFILQFPTVVVISQQSEIISKDADSSVLTKQNAINRSHFILIFVCQDEEKNHFNCKCENGEMIYLSVSIQKLVRNKIKIVSTLDLIFIGE